MSAAQLLPHQVEIFYNTADVNPICAGTIIASYLVLTAASCFVGKNESLFQIRPKRENHDDQIRTIDQVYTFAALDSDPSSSFDVALIRLNSTLVLDDDVHTSQIHYDQSGRALSENLTAKASVCHNDDGNREVKTTAASQCFQNLEGKARKNFVCTEPTSALEGDGNCQLPLAGSSLLCTNDANVDFLCGVLTTNASSAENNQIKNIGKMGYTSIGPYSHWIHFALEEEETDENDHGLVQASSNSQVVNQTTNQVPYQLSLQFDGRHICGGVILDKKTALSAAHCFPSTNITRYKLVAGEQTLNKSETTEQIFQIEKLFKHQSYRTILGGSDIALIHVQGEFNFNDRVNNVWISSPSSPKSDVDFKALKGTATGWGQTVNKGQTSNILMFVQLEFMERAECKKKWSFVNDRMFCGHSYLSNVCSGDSGGPFVIQNYDHGQNLRKQDLLVGITSFAPTECEKQDEANGFTNVTYFYRWIAAKRFKSFCLSSQFQCFNGECIDGELKCNKKFDCADGSDEKICQPHNTFEAYTRTTQDCGGLIKVAYGHEIKWQAPASHPHQNSSCLWLIATINPHADRPTTTTIKILESKTHGFDAATSQLNVIQSLTGNQMSTSLLDKIGTEYNFNEPFLMLHFRTNSSAPNNGIHLRITEQSDPSPNIAKHLQGLILKADVNQNTRQIQSFSHVYSGSHCRKMEKSRNIFQNAPPQNSTQSPVNPPYIVSIQLNDEHICSGIILDKNLVLSTASCFDWSESEDESQAAAQLQSNLDTIIKEIRIVAGGKNLELNLSRADATEQILEIKRVVRHENWRFSRITEGNDIALIRVKGEFNFTGHINNIWISAPETLNLEGKSGSVSAWITAEGEATEFLPDLRTTNMNLLEQSECKKNYRFWTDSMMCAFANGTNVCGMSGAPFVLKNHKLGQISKDILIGLSTFGPYTCQSIKRPVAFTRVDHFYDWIETNRETSSCSASQFQCYNGQCIDEKLKCNYVFDCSDGSDEAVCTAAGATTVKTLDSCARHPENEISKENNFYLFIDLFGFNNVAAEIAAIEDENLFLFLKPLENGGRIQVHLDSLQMATTLDSFDIFSYRQNTLEITSLSSVRGAGKCSDEIYYGDENEPILMYFHAHPSHHNQNISFNYFERPKISPSASCGGVLELENELEIVYQIPEESQNSDSDLDQRPETICEWKIRNSNGSSIEATFFHNPLANFDAATSFLSFVDNSSPSTSIKLDQNYVTQNVDFPSTNLTFRSTSRDPNTGFHLYIKNRNSRH